MNHEQDWYDRELGFEWARDVYTPRDFEERVLRVMDLVRLDFAVRALYLICIPHTSKGQKTSHTKLNGLYLEGQFRQRYLAPTIV